MFKEGKLAFTLLNLGTLILYHGQTGSCPLGGIKKTMTTCPNPPTCILKIPKYNESYPNCDQCLKEFTDIADYIHLEYSVEAIKQ